MSSNHSSWDELIVSITYYAQRKLYNHICSICEDVLRKRVADPLAGFWRAAGLIFQGKHNEALRELQGLSSERDLTLALTTAMIYAHEHCSPVDHEVVDELQARLTVESSSSSSMSNNAFLSVGLFDWLTNNPDRARDWLRKGLAEHAGALDLMAALGWIEVTNPTLGLKSSSWFEKVLEKDPKHLAASFGRMQLSRHQKRPVNQTLEIISQIAVHHPTFKPAYIERMYLLLEINSWDQALEASARIAGLMPDSIDATIVTSLADLCRDGNFEATAMHLGSVSKALVKLEPANAELFSWVAAPFIRLASRNAGILDLCAKLLEKCITWKSDNSAYRTELAYVQLLLGNVPRAKEMYKAASQLDPHNIHALTGTIRCQILSGQYDNAEEQLDILNELQMSMGKSAEIAYLSSMLAWNKYKDVRKRRRCLKEACDIQIQVMKNGSPSPDFYVACNPDFVTEIGRDYVESLPMDSKRESGESDADMQTVQELFELMYRVVPGNLDSALLLAKVQFMAGNNAGAQTIASHCLRLDATYAKAHLLSAEIYLAGSRYQQALSSLEMALSSNFDIRKTPRFHILKARALKAEGDFQEALTSLQTAMDLPAMKRSAAGKDVEPITTDDRIALYVELTETHSKLGQTAEATKVIQEAMQNFAGTPAEDRFTLTNAELMVLRGEHDEALKLLGAVRPDSGNFIEARKTMARIFLEHRNDRKMYAQCYRDMVERQPSVENCLLLGDAYLDIQEPDKAIAVYESVIDSKTEKHLVATRLGKALVKTHDYARATAFYESALQHDGHQASFALRYDLANLYKKLKQYDDAMRVINERLDQSSGDGLDSMMEDVKLYVLLAQVQKLNSEADKACGSFLRARELQLSIISRDVVGHDRKGHRDVASDICYELADLYTHVLRDMEKAIAYFNESIQCNDSNRKSMLGLAQLHLSRNDLNAAQNQCSQMIRMDIAKEESTLMLAEILYRRNSYAAAAIHFRQLLEQTPGNYEALMRVVEMTRRSGKLEESKEFFDLVEKRQPKAHLHPGWHFCKGLHARYMNKPNDALQEFNASRWDAEWAERSLYNMIEIYLNPENDIIGGEALGQAADGEGKSDTELLAILNADKLLKELTQNPKTLRTQVLECHTLMATKQKSEIERAIERFSQILNEERDYVPALLGMAVGYVLLKQPPRARNQLKRISKMEWSSDLADDFEKSWLLLADIYIQGGKFDLATELLKRCLNYNRSCAKAWEYLGHIMEKESSFKDAADNYEMAWKLEGESNPAMGFKLAFNHLKAKKFVEAIDVCHKVFSSHPDYPKLRKEILERARSALRFP